MKEFKYNTISFLTIIFLGVLLVSGLLSVFSPPSVSAGIGGGFFAFRPVAGVTVASSALNAAIGTDTILSVTEAGELNSIIVEVDGVNVTGTPSVDLLVTVDGTQSTIPLYVGGTTFPTWVQQLSNTQPSSSSGNALFQEPTQTTVDLVLAGAATFRPALQVTESGILHGINITVGQNMSPDVNSEFLLRIIADGVIEDITLYDVGLNTWEPWTGFLVANVFNSSGNGATAGDAINLALHIPYQNSLQIGIFQVADAMMTGNLDFNIVRSATSVGGSSGATTGNRFKWDINAQYLQSLLVEVDRTAVATSASRLNVSVLRNRRVPN